jgi:hypothetical protein
MTGELFKNVDVKAEFKYLYFYLLAANLPQFTINFAFTDKTLLLLMSLVAHQFGCVEFCISVFYRQAKLKKSKKSSKFDGSKSMDLKLNCLINGSTKPNSYSVA